MSESERFERGVEMLNAVYAGQIPSPPKGSNAFMDLMVEQLFGEVWAREALSVRDRRLLTMGVIAAAGDAGLWQIQIRAALKNGELEVEQAREAVIHLAQYAGYPRVGGLVGATEQVIASLSEED